MHLSGLFTLLALITDLYLAHIWKARCSTGAQPITEQLAAHRLEKSSFVRLRVELLSADNPTEIAHGFPVPEVANKHTPVEYLMRALWESLHLKTPL